MAVQVYGCNHVVIEVDNAEKAVEFYSDVFNLTMLRGGEGAAWCKLGEHQFMAIFEVNELRPDRVKHFKVRKGLPVRFSRSLGQPYSGGGSSRRVACMASSLCRSPKGRYYVREVIGRRAV